VVFGDAAAPGILAAAGIEHARLLIAASPNGYQSRRAFEIAREANPEIDTLVRTHSESEHDWLERAHVGMAVAAEQEVALGMMGYALRSLGLSEGEVRMFVQSARTFDDAGLRQGRPEEPPPELRR
jgi:CPA2 family monovalent cation:H+ antiporter-2